MWKLWGCSQPSVRNEFIPETGWAFETILSGSKAPKSDQIHDDLNYFWPRIKYCYAVKFNNSGVTLPQPLRRRQSPPVLSTRLRNWFRFRHPDECQAIKALNVVSVAVSLATRTRLSRYSMPAHAIDVDWAEAFTFTYKQI